MKLGQQGLLHRLHNVPHGWGRTVQCKQAWVHDLKADHGVSLPTETQMVPKVAKNGCQSERPGTISPVTFKALKSDRQNSAQRAPKGAQEDQHGIQSGPNGTQMVPKVAQMVPKKIPNGTQSCKNGCQSERPGTISPVTFMALKSDRQNSAQRVPKGAQEDQHGIQSGQNGKGGSSFSFFLFPSLLFYSILFCSILFSFIPTLLFYSLSSVLCSSRHVSSRLDRPLLAPLFSFPLHSSPLFP